MQFANEHEIESWVQQWAADPVLAAAARTLCSLKDAVNGCSDGWPYWPAPSRSAQALVGLLADADRACRPLIGDLLAEAAGNVWPAIVSEL
jgi:hypothetical protein